MRFKWQDYPVEVKLILSIYSIGFLIGTFTHLQGIWLNGVFGANVPLFFNVYWDSLSLLDPLAALLVWGKPRTGIALAVFIMLTDIAINAYGYAIGIFGEPVAGMVPLSLFLQSLFGTYVFVTAPVVMEKLKRRSLVKTKFGA